MKDEDIVVSISEPKTIKIEEQLSIKGTQDPQTRKVPLRSQVAARLAYIVAVAFAAGTFFCFIFMFFLFFGANIETIKADGSKITQKDFSQGFELFKTFSAFMTGPLGFVLGFYFREESKRDETKK